MDRSVVYTHDFVLILQILQHFVEKVARLELTYYLFVYKIVNLQRFLRHDYQHLLLLQLHQENLGKYAVNQIWENVQALSRRFP